MEAITEASTCGLGKSVFSPRHAFLSTMSACLFFHSKIQSNSIYHNSPVMFIHIQYLRSQIPQKKDLCLKRREGPSKKPQIKQTTVNGKIILKINFWNFAEEPLNFPLDCRLDRLPIPIPPDMLTLNLKLCISSLCVSFPALCLRHHLGRFFTSHYETKTSSLKCQDFVFN